MKFEKAAFKHAFTEKQILEAINDPFSTWYQDSDSNKGNMRIMYVGSTTEGVCLEVGVEVREDDDYVYHARVAKKATMKRAEYED